MKKILLFLLLFLFSCSNDYQNYHEEKQNLQTQNDELKNQISDFNLEKLNIFLELHLILHQIQNI